MLVGEDEDRCIIHKSTACEKSPFFAAACSSRWIEGQEGIVRLPDHGPLSFDVFVHWMYSGELDIMKSRPDNTPPYIYYSFVRVWELANYLGCPSLCNLAASSLIQRISEHPRRYPVKNCFDAAPPGSKIRALLVDHVIWRPSVPYFDKSSGSWPPEVIHKLARITVAKEDRESYSPLGRDRCFYHVHKEGEKCPEP